MGETTHISWADATFNPWVGCTKVSPACDGCYAEHMMATRMGRVTWGAPGAGEGTRERTSAANWRKPLAWDRAAAKSGARPFVFCSSLADVFDNAVPMEWRRDLFDLIHATPHLTWLLLTKRPGNIVKLFDLAYRPDGEAQSIGERAGNWPRNAAIGCTVVTQEEADRDVPKLLAAKAALGPAFAFVSMEPLLGPVDLTRIDTMAFRGAERFDALTGKLEGMFGDPAGYFERLDWVITGGETDQGQHKARPADPAWYRSLRDQCEAADVAFHHKQNGEWCEFGERGMLADGSINFLGRPDDAPERRAIFGDTIVQKVGKAKAGRFLDGVIHDARPVLP